MVEIRLLLPCQVAVVVQPILSLRRLQGRFAPFQPARLFRIQSSGADAVRDTFLLVTITAVNLFHARMIVSSRGLSNKTKDQSGADQYRELGR